MTRAQGVGDYLDQMAEAATQACAYVEGLDKATFLQDRRTQQACVLNLMILGEAATRLQHAFPDFVQHHPELPWRSVKGMRNRIAHGYFELDLDVVWDTLQIALPELQLQLPPLLASVARRAG